MKFKSMIASVILLVVLFVAAGLITVQEPDEPELDIGVQALADTPFIYQGHLVDSDSPANGQYDFRLLLFFVSIALAQGYDLSWWTVDGGGGPTSQGGNYALSGTMGQPDAGRLSGGSYILVVPLDRDVRAEWTTIGGQRPIQPARSGR